MPYGHLRFETLGAPTIVGLLSVTNAELTISVDRTIGAEAATARATKLKPNCALALSRAK